MTDREALIELRDKVESALRPDSGATVNGLLGDLSLTLTMVGLDPMGELPVPAAPASDRAAAQSRH